MINLLLGAPGGGKSYEAVAFHVLVALAKGRKVITNLPLVVEEFGNIDPTYPDLIELRTKTLKPAPLEEEAKPGRASLFSRPQEYRVIPFANREDFGDGWRHPETGAGPLYVIDECHLCHPRGSTPRDVEEWYSLHRHETADVLLITQSYGKVSKSIIDLVQVVYRVRKNVAFGSQKSYTRKVQDGIRGDVVNTAIREYKPRYFKLYKSHTRGGGSELSANDIIPFWKRWPVLGAGFFFLLAAVLPFVFDFKDPFKAGSHVSPKAQQSMVGQPNPRPNVPKPAPPSFAEPRGLEQKEADGNPEPYKGYGVHLVGSIQMPGRTRYYFTISQNGQPVSHAQSEDLERLGYKVEVRGDCAGWLTYAGRIRSVVCDAPAVQLMGSPAAGGSKPGDSPAPATPPAPTANPQQVASINP